MADGGIPIVGYGAGGHARSLLEALRSGGRFVVVGLADDDPGRDGETVLGVPVAAGDGALEAFREQGVEHAFVGIGGVTSAAGRRQALGRLAAAGFALPPVVHATAAVSPWADLGAGAQVLALAVVNA